MTEPRPTRSDWFNWLLASAWWPPYLALVVALAVFLLVGARTPPGLGAAMHDFFAGDRDHALAAAYLLGAASTLALGALFGVAALGVLLAAVWRLARYGARTDRA